MKILFLVSSLGSGGAERVATTLSNAWAARGDSITLVTTFSGGGESFYPLHRDVAHISLSQRCGAVGAAGGKRYLRRLRELRSIVRQFRPDVVLSFLPNVNIAALLATAFTGTPCIVCERSDPRHMPTGSAWRIACNLLYRYADCVAVQTTSVAEGITRLYGGLRNVVVLPNPLPVDLMDSEAVFMDRCRRTLVSMGRLSDEKGFDLAIDTFVSIADAHPEWDMHIYGEGPLRDQLQAKIDAHCLSARVKLMGATKRPWDIMAKSDAFIMSSKFEGFPNALLEAMGVGLPCIAIDCPSGPAEITRNGADALLVPLNDPMSLRSALSSLLGDSDLRRSLGHNARRSVAERYGTDVVLGMWDKVFHSVCCHE